MVITEKRIAANRRNIELGREKAKLSMHRIKEYNQTKTEHTFTCTKCGKEFTRSGGKDAVPLGRHMRAGRNKN